VAAFTPELVEGFTLALEEAFTQELVAVCTPALEEASTTVPGADCIQELAKSLIEAISRPGLCLSTN
jgi:hypothetical protein